MRIRARSRLCDLLTVSRERWALTQQEAARRLGISTQYLCDIEKGRRPFPVHRTKDFVRVYGLEPQMLIEMATWEWLEPLTHGVYEIDDVSIRLRMAGGE